MIYKNTSNFVTLFGLQQLISFPTRNSTPTTIIDHILASYPDKVSQKRIIDIGISDCQLIFCTQEN